MCVDDDIWPGLKGEAQAISEAEPILRDYLHAAILAHQTMESALSCLLSTKLAEINLPSEALRDVIEQVFLASSKIKTALRLDLTAAADRDAAAHGMAHPFLNYKGYHALQSYRVSHWLYANGRTALALYLQSRISEVFAVDIHPAAIIGSGIFIDHATGVVIGETAVVGDDVSILQGVTLGGTGKEAGDRHPKIESGVLLAAGAKVLGNIRIGTCSKVGAGSVVLADVPPHSTVVGVPARIAGRPASDHPASSMD